MALIRRDQSQGRAVAGVRLELGDLSRQADRIRDVALKEAESIIVEARKERERIISGARDEGFAKGLEEGRALGKTEGLKAGKDAAVVDWNARFTALQGGFVTALDQFRAARERMLFEAQQDILKLAVLFSERALKRRIEIDPTVIRDQMAAVLAVVARSTALTLRVHPDDLALARESLPELLKRFAPDSHATLEGDPSLSRGSVVARTVKGGIVDASIDTQLSRLIEAIMPGASAAKPSTPEDVASTEKAPDKTPEQGP